MITHRLSHTEAECETYCTVYAQAVNLYCYTDKKDCIYPYRKYELTHLQIKVVGL